jgi:hypothetical protein
MAGGLFEQAEFSENLAGQRDVLRQPRVALSILHLKFGIGNRHTPAELFG